MKGIPQGARLLAAETPLLYCFVHPGCTHGPLSLLCSAAAGPAAVVSQAMAGLWGVGKGGSQDTGLGEMPFWILQQEGLGRDKK